MTWLIILIFKRYLTFTIREKHNENCGGEPNTSPVAARVKARFDNDGATKSLYVYDPVNDEYHITALN